MKRIRVALIGYLIAACVPWTVEAQVSPETLKQISTPDRVETRLGLALHRDVPVPEMNQ